ncbi:hypothetical protein GUJ93_ZPchr0006g44680 [Zizania palustris]|uniref:Uncharacterized protein n=1 Tax=Zizania palustris TaxID=103762 RepID=A0A8J5VGW6_ZIZPA|nr:hypothetical protein GUJ93_ZPchr0006g44680 [Zizania palustris]KAG8070024.1 hypothetical protein GUJ93_ZPchr0006g44680 [Zizania palustris]
MYLASDLSEEETRELFIYAIWQVRKKFLLNCYGLAPSLHKKGRKQLHSFRAVAGTTTEESDTVACNGESRL